MRNKSYNNNNSLTFWTIFAPFSKIEKVAENGRKVKAIALLFCCLFPIDEKWKNRYAVRTCCKPFEYMSIVDRADKV
jgi:hypothetical protein